MKVQIETKTKSVVTIEMAPETAIDLSVVLSGKPLSLSPGLKSLREKLKAVRPRLEEVRHGS